MTAGGAPQAASAAAMPVPLPRQRHRDALRISGAGKGGSAVDKYRFFWHHSMKEAVKRGSFPLSGGRLTN